MGYLDDLREKLNYLEQSDANKDAADALRAQITDEEAATKPRPKKKPTVKTGGVGLLQ